MWPTVCFGWVLCFGTHYFQEEAEGVGYTRILLQEVRQRNARVEQLLQGVRPLRGMRPLPRPMAPPPRPMPPMRP